jgi:lincosamide nucleotidyltransferase A/C/D/E
MDILEVVRVLGALSAASCPAWVAGGWGVDALVGKQTRPHRDLDLAVRAEQLDEVLAATTALGYAVATDWLPVRLEVGSSVGWVDLHPVVFDDNGDGRQDNGEGDYFRYPAAGFVTGTLDGRPVPCLSAALQLEVHSGYEPREVDLLDIALLRELLA